MPRNPIIEYYDGTVDYTRRSVEFPENSDLYPEFLYRAKVRIYIDTQGFALGKKVSVGLEIGGLNGSSFNVEKNLSVIANGDYVLAYTGNAEWNWPDSETTTVQVWAEYAGGTTKTASEILSVQPTGIYNAPTASIYPASPSFGDQIEIIIARKSGDGRSTYNLYYSHTNTVNWTKLAENISVNYQWTIPKNLASQMPRATDKLQLKIEFLDPAFPVKNKPQIIGEQYIDFTPKTTSDMAPSLTITTADAKTAIASKFGKFVKSKSQVKATVSFVGQYSATFKNGTLKKGAETLNITSASQTLTFQGVVDSTSFNIVGKVTDSRNQSATVTSAQTAYDWEAPKVTTLKVTRCNQDGTANDAGEYAKVQFNVSISPCGNKNDKALQIQYKKRADSSWTSQSITMSGYTLNSNIIFAADTESVYDVKINLTDYFQTTTASATLSTAFTLMDFHKGGKGMAIGKVAETANELDIGIPTRTRKGLSSDIGWAVLRNKETNNDFNTLYFYNNDGTDDIYTGCYIRAYDDDENGSILIARAGGAFIAGGGEFASSYYANNKTSLAGTEQTFLGSDSAVNIITGYNTPANAKQWTFNANGNITTPSGGLINGKDVTKLAGFYTANTSSAEVGQSTTNRVVVRTNGAAFNDTGLIAHDNTLNLYDYTASEQLWRINITKGDTVNLSNINAKITNNDVTPTYQDLYLEIYGIWAGHVTNSNSSLDFFVPLQKALKADIDEVRIYLNSDNTTYDLSVRGPNGYLNSKQYLTVDDISDTARIMAKRQYGVHIRVDCKSGTWTNISNNRPVSVQGRIYLNPS